MSCLYNVIMCGLGVRCVVLTIVRFSYFLNWLHGPFLSQTLCVAPVHSAMNGSPYDGLAAHPGAILISSGASFQKLKKKNSAKPLVISVV